MKKKKHLYNKINSEELKFALANEPFERITASFYKYVDISVPNELRDELYEVWNQMGVFGRVYIADEGINAQVSIPKQNWQIFMIFLGTLKLKRQSRKDPPFIN